MKFKMEVKVNVKAGRRQLLRSSASTPHRRTQPSLRSFTHHLLLHLPFYTLAKMSGASLVSVKYRDGVLLAADELGS
jgi:hypothetical protein